MTRPFIITMTFLLACPLVQANDFSSPPGIAKPFSLPQTPSTEAVETTIKEQKSKAIQQSSKTLWIHSISFENFSEKPGIKRQDLEQWANHVLTQLAQDQDSSIGTQIQIKHLAIIVEQITNFYRSKGYVLSSAYLPEQALIEEGSDLLIGIREPLLEQVVLVPSERFYAKKDLKKPWQPYISQPVYIPNVQSAITTINHYPGMRAKAVFAPGTTPNTTQINLDLSESFRSDSQILINNFGSDVTGKYRLGIQTTWNNPLSLLDQLSASYTQNVDPNEGGSWLLSYQVPLFADINTQLGIQYAQNIFDLGAEFKNTGISGAYWQTQAFIKHWLSRSNTKTSSIQASFIRQNSVTELKSNKLKEDDLSTMGINGFYSTLLPQYHSFASFQLGYTRGLPNVLGSMDRYHPDKNNAPPSQGRDQHYAKGAFNRVNMDGILSYWPYSHLTISWQLSGQWTPDLLTSLERKSLGNAYLLKAYDSEYMVDSAIITSISGQFSWHIHQECTVKPGAFIEYGQGRVHYPDAFEVENHIDGVELYDYGLSLNTQLWGFTAELNYARPFESSKKPLDKTSYRMWFQLKQAIRL